jgi:hypothetical protein
MKRLMVFLVSIAAVLTLNGCGGGGGSDYYEDPVNDGLTTLFLIDQDGNSYAEVPYLCDSMIDWSYTAPNGEFSFYPGEDCKFDFLGLDGNYFDDPLVDDIVYIVDDLDYGKGGIPYECASFGVGTTYTDGSFDYDLDDQCVFYL